MHAPVSFLARAIDASPTTCSRLTSPRLSIPPPAPHIHLFCADITVNGKLVLQASKGMGFGELALLYDAPRAASVTATSPEVHAWAIDRNTFKQVSLPIRLWVHLYLQAMDMLQLR